MCLGTSGLQQSLTGKPAGQSEGRPIPSALVSNTPPSSGPPSLPPPRLCQPLALLFILFFSLTSWRHFQTLRIRLKSSFTCSPFPFWLRLTFILRVQPGAQLRVERCNPPALDFLPTIPTSSGEKLTRGSPQRGVELLGQISQTV